jgi:hypothetical protein
MITCYAALIRGSLYGLNYMSKHKNDNRGIIMNLASVVLASDIAGIIYYIYNELLIYSPFSSDFSHMHYSRLF